MNIKKKKEEKRKWSGHQNQMWLITPAMDFRRRGDPAQGKAKILELLVINEAPISQMKYTTEWNAHVDVVA